MKESNKLNMISPISVAGGYWTGSSAVVDLLSEHSECKVIPGEFSLFSFGQLFEELFIEIDNPDNKTTSFSMNIRRMEDFNKSDLRPLRPFLRKLFTLVNNYPTLLFNPRSGMKNILGKDYYSSCLKLLKELDTSKNNLSNLNLDKVKQIVSEILTSAAQFQKEKESANNVKYGVFDQIIAPPYIKYSKRIIPKMKFINVDRDYRDQYISLRGIFRRMMARNRALGIRPFAEDLSIIEKSPIDFMVRLRDRIESSKKIILENNNDLMWVSYEELVLNSKEVSSKIFNFLDLDISKWEKGQNFFPKKSSSRIAKWKRGKWIKEPYKSEIAELEEKINVF